MIARPATALHLQHGALLDGWQACRDGLGLDANPWREALDPERAFAWSEGWAERLRMEQRERADATAHSSE